MIKILIVEDDMVSRKLLAKALMPYGDCDMVVDGMEAIEAYMMAIQENQPYQLICLDIMMPRVDGIKVLKAIRELEQQSHTEEAKRVKIIMTTALGETGAVQEAFRLGGDGYAAKPIDIGKFIEVLRQLNLVE